MPWPRQHKKQTRERILAAAAEAIRERGPDGVAVADVMDRAGLTHGGFYAHFASKDELLAHALELACEASMTPLAESASAAAEADRLRSVVDAYLSPWHLNHVAVGCPVAAIAPEVARAGGRLQRNLGKAIQERIDWIRSLLPKSRSAARRHDEAIGVLASMVGGLVLARALGGESGSGRELLDANRRFLHRVIADQS